MPHAKQERLPLERLEVLEMFLLRRVQELDRWDWRELRGVYPPGHPIRESVTQAKCAMMRACQCIDRECERA